MPGPDPDGPGSDSESKWKKYARAAGSSLSESGQSIMRASGDRAASEADRLDSYKKGGRVKSTGPANLHRGELVIPRGKVKKVRKAMRRSKGRS